MDSIEVWLPVFGVATIYGVLCGLLGIFVVSSRMSLMGDTLGHAAFPGLCFSFLIFTSPNVGMIYTGALVTCFLSMLLISGLKKFSSLKEESILGIAIPVFFSAGVLIMGIVQKNPAGQKAGLQKYLLGQIAAVGWGDFKMALFLLAVGSLSILVFARPWWWSAFDPNFFLAKGKKVSLYRFLFLILVSSVVILAARSVGVILISGLMVIPATIGWMIGGGLLSAILISVGVGTLSSLLGCFLSLKMSHLPTGPAIVLCSSLMFIAYLSFRSVRTQRL